MSDLTPRPDYTPRASREQRAYRLVMVGGGAAAVAAVGIVLAAVGVIGAGIPLLAIVVAVICGLLFLRTVRR